MFVIKITDTTARKSGYFRKIKIHTGKEYRNKNNGKQRIEPVFATEEYEIKPWRYKNAAIKYAITLGDQFEIVYKDPNNLYFTTERIHEMKYNIEVIDQNTGATVFTVPAWRKTLPY